MQRRCAAKEKVAAVLADAEAKRREAEDVVCNDASAKKYQE